MTTKHQAYTDEIIEILGQWIDPAEPVWRRIHWITQRLFEAEVLAKTVDAMDHALTEVASIERRDRVQVKAEWRAAQAAHTIALAAYREGRKQ